MLSSFYKLKIRKLISATSVRYLCRIIYATHIVLSKYKKLRKSMLKRTKIPCKMQYTIIASNSISLGAGTLTASLLFGVCWWGRIHVWVNCSFFYYFDFGFERLSVQSELLIPCLTTNSDMAVYDQNFRPPLSRKLSRRPNLFNFETQS